MVGSTQVGARCHSTFSPDLFARRSFLLSNVAVIFGRALAALTCAVLAFAWASAPAAADDALNILGGSAAPTMLDVPDLVAQGLGLFKQEHLDINKQFVGTAFTCTQLLATGKGDVCSASMEPVISGYEKGVRLTFFYNRDPLYDYALAVLSTSPIKTLGDFKGMTLGEYTTGSAAEITANNQLSGAGLRKSDYSYIPVGGGAQGLLALTSGKVNGFAMPDAEMAMDGVIGNVKFHIFRDPILSDVPNVGYMASPATIASKADLLKRYTRAMVKADLFVHYNPAVAARYFLQQSNQKVTPDSLALITKQIEAYENSLPAADPSSKRIGYFPVNGVAIYTKFMLADGLAHVLVPANELVTNQFIAYANDFDKKAYIAWVKAQK
jgi:NitT/TauT family transport system substrate-binding protein